MKAEGGNLQCVSLNFHPSTSSFYFCCPSLHNMQTALAHEPKLLPIRAIEIFVHGFPAAGPGFVVIDDYSSSGHQARRDFLQAHHDGVIPVGINVGKSTSRIQVKSVLIESLD